MTEEEHLSESNLNTELKNAIELSIKDFKATLFIEELILNEIIKEEEESSKQKVSTKEETSIENSVTQENSVNEGTSTEKDSTKIESSTQEGETSRNL